ncbi:MAG: HD domain-containing protein [Lachnospiraceae bacterium]|nr:HD domain-containing protein [Lachnospiraceae bacterium]
MNDGKFKELLQKRPNITALILCAAGVALNIMLNAVTIALDIPLYLDTVGTIAIAVMGGTLPGVIVGFATNTLRAITNTSSMYYGALSVLIALFAAFMAHRGLHKKVGGIALMVAVFTVIGGVIGAFIPWFMEDINIEGDALNSLLYETGLFSHGLSHFFSKLVTDLLDKSITVLIALSITRIVPESFYRYFNFTMWRQNPLAESEDIRKQKTDVRYISFRTKTLMILVLSLGIVAVVFTVLSASIFRKTLIEEHARIAGGIAKVAADEIDPDLVDGFLLSKGTSEGYTETKESLRKILSGSPEIKYLYVYRIEPDGCHVVFDFDIDEVEGDPVGTVIPFDEAFSDKIPDFLAGRPVALVVSDESFGYLLTVYEPVYDSGGRCVCYVGVDVDMEKMNVYGRSFLTEMIAVFSGFFILLCTITVWFTDYLLIYPISSIVRGMNRIADSSDTQGSMDEDVKMFRSIGIHTGDELETLFLSASRMTRNQAEQLRSIRRLSESTAKMQDGLIITMADLVESRDSDTGAHVQKTAAYVKIIVEGLNKKGYYPSKITPKFMSDVVRSAPLHDIGKINIPDGVLNKPGKLTDEEFAIMKTHTTAGKRIMENAIKTVEGDNYLKEARNMAAYHHERWDGKGYPEGLHGEVIPLSARIMAVADVFDALTSPRVYKPAFPLDKALAILEEGKGTQFDPKCIEVFMDALPEVKVILNKYNSGV